jgi:hypothetical protein
LSATTEIVSTPNFFHRQIILKYNIEQILMYTTHESINHWLCDTHVGNPGFEHSIPTFLSWQCWTSVQSLSIQLGLTPGLNESPLTLIQHYQWISHCSIVIHQWPHKDEYMDPIRSGSKWKYTLKFKVKAYSQVQSESIRSGSKWKYTLRFKVKVYAQVQSESIRSSSKWKYTLKFKVKV